MIMSDEDFSELAEALEDACVKYFDAGRIISSFDEPNHLSPFGALLEGSMGRIPYPETVETITGIPAAVVGAFNQGFMGSKRFSYFSVKAYNLGRQFRDQWVRL